MSATSEKFFCELCQRKSKTAEAITFCCECHQFYCQGCAERHIKMKISKIHTQVRIGSPTATSDSSICKCDGCDGSLSAEAICLDCKELYCIDCETYHKGIKACQDHFLVKVSFEFSKSCDENPSQSSPAVVDNKIHQSYKLLDCVPSNSNYAIPSAPPISEVITENESLGVRLPSYQEATASQEMKNQRKISVKANDQLEQEPLCKKSDSEFYQDRHCRRLNGKQSQSKPLLAKHFTKFCVRSPNDVKSCDINSMVTLADGKIVLVDVKNKTLKLCSEMYVLISSIGIQTKVRVVTIWDRDTIALADQRKILFYRADALDGLQKLPHEINLDYEICDIAYDDGGFICLCKKKGVTHLIRVYGDGRVNVFVENVAKCLYNSFLCIYQPAGIIVYGCDEDKEEKIVCYSLDGKRLWSVPIKSGIKGITAFNESVIVAQYAKHALHQMTPDGYLNPTPLIADDDRVKHPHALAIQDKYNRLLISNHSLDNDNVMVYSIFS